MRTHIEGLFGVSLIFDAEIQLKLGVWSFWKVIIQDVYVEAVLIPRGSRGQGGRGAVVRSGSGDRMPRPVGGIWNTTDCNCLV